MKWLVLNYHWCKLHLHFCVSDMLLRKIEIDIRTWFIIAIQVHRDSRGDLMQSREVIEIHYTRIISHLEFTKCNLHIFN